MTDTPLTDAVRTYRSSARARLHVPAHGGGTGSPWLDAWLPGICSWDVTEQPELDDLSHPEGPIAAAQAAAAHLFGGARAYYLTGGATQGVQAAVLASLLRGGSLLAPRDSHRSVLGAALLADAEVVMVSPERDPRFGASLGPSVESVERALAQHPDIRAVLVPYPSYLGVAPDLEGIARAARAHGALTIADAAHGAHFGWHPALPPAALGQGADMVVAGMHKSGGSLTQTAILLLAESAAECSEDVALALRLIGTSSPSYLLMISLELAVAAAARGAGERIETAVAAAARIASPARVVTARPQDPLRVALQFDRPADAEELYRGFAAAGLRGEYLEEGLALFIVPFGVPKPEIEMLSAAAAELPAPRPPSAIQTLPTQRIAPASALRSPRERRGLFEAEGRVSADVVAPVPPGIPALWPGERITAQALSAIERALAQGLRVLGIEQQSLWVVAQ